MLEYENKWRKLGKTRIAGTDEAGRGPLAGPVVAASCIFDEGVFIEGINDSKKLSEKKREKLFDEIIEKCRCYAICEVDSQKIDEINILAATKLAMANCVRSLCEKPDVVLIDGNFTFDCECVTEPIIKGDSLSFSIAAASILAKVTRDRIMEKYDEIYPVYGFSKHKGYGTKLHYEKIREHGECPIHRKSFRLY